MQILFWYVFLSRGLRRESAIARFLGLRVRIPPDVWLSLSWECCVSSGRGLCDELVTRPEESYRLWSVVVCDLESSMRKPWPALGRSAKEVNDISICALIMTSFNRALQLIQRPIQWVLCILSLR
jgi:hypothetical protein